MGDGSNTPSYTPVIKPFSTGIEPDESLESLTRKVTWTVTRPVSRQWLGQFTLASLLVGLLILSIVYLLVAGVGIWGVNIPVAWGFAIVNFAWWIGLAHSGTFISAALMLTNENWRKSIRRIADTMTLLALACAGLFPLLHMGRPWFFYWLFPYPNSLGIWPQFRSALVWDVFAIMAYSLVAVLFWYLEVIPDAATLRDRSRSRVRKIVYTVLALGWRGEAAQWQLFEKTQRLLAGLIAALVVLHSVGALNLATSIVPGWHSTIFPAYFLASAVHSGAALLMMLLIPLRPTLDLRKIITPRHLQDLAKLLLATSVVIGYGHVMEIFGQWYAGQEAEWNVARIRIVGTYTWLYWTMISATVLVPQILWFRYFRSSSISLLLVCTFVLAGMWLERYMIVISSLHHNFLPPDWVPYQPTVWDITTFLGTCGLFLALLLIFIRVLPAVPLSEVRQMIIEPTETTVRGG